MHILPHSVSDVVSQEVTGMTHTADSLANLAGRAEQWEKSLCFPGGWRMQRHIKPSTHTCESASGHQDQCVSSQYTLQGRPLRQCEGWVIHPGKEKVSKDPFTIFRDLMGDYR